MAAEAASLALDMEEEQPDSSSMVVDAQEEPAFRLGEPIASYMPDRWGLSMHMPICCLQGVTGSVCASMYSIGGGRVQESKVTSDSVPVRAGELVTRKSIKMTVPPQELQMKAAPGRVDCNTVHQHAEVWFVE